MEVYKFKVKDYTTILVGFKELDCSTPKGDYYNYYVIRGDGTKYIYADYRVEWAEIIATI